MMLKRTLGLDRAIAAHESGSVDIHEGRRVQGDATRLESLQRKTIAWHLVAGAIFMSSLLPLGCSRRRDIAVSVALQEGL